MNEATDERAGLIRARQILHDLARDELGEAKALYDTEDVPRRDRRLLETLSAERRFGRLDALLDAARALERAVEKPPKLDPAPPPFPDPGLLVARPRPSRRRWWQRPAPDCNEWHWQPPPPPTPPPVPNPGIREDLGPINYNG